MSHNKLSKKAIILIIVAVIIVIVVVLFFVMKKGKQSEVRYETDRSAIDSIEVTVTATGEIQPVYEVEVGTQVSGIVEKLYVDFNSHVKKGQLLAQLDRSTLNEQLTQSQAAVSNAQSNLKLAQQSYDRVKSLYDSKAATQESYESATNVLVVAKNQLRTAESDLQKAQVNLSYSTIYSPIDGVVLDKAVEEGQTVAASFSTPTLFTIANDLTQMQVEANVDEADIGDVHAGQHVTFTVDAFSDDKFSGTVKEVRLNPTVSSNVVTYTVIIQAPNPDLKLYPGMTANVSIITKKESGVAIPMQALYVNIDEMAMKQLEKKGIKVNSLYANQDQIAQGLKDITKKTIWIKSGNTYVQRSVTTGLNNGVKTLISSGLKEGEEVLVSAGQTAGPNKEDESGVSKSFMPHPTDKKR